MPPPRPPGARLEGLRQGRCAPADARQRRRPPQRGLPRSARHWRRPTYRRHGVILKRRGQRHRRCNHDRPTSTTRTSSPSTARATRPHDQERSQGSQLSPASRASSSPAVATNSCGTRQGRHERVLAPGRSAPAPRRAARQLGQLSDQPVSPRIDPRPPSAEGLHDTPQAQSRNSCATVENILPCGIPSLIGSAPGSCARTRVRRNGRHLYEETR